LDILADGLAVGKEEPGQVLIGQSASLGVSFLGDAMQDALLELPQAVLLPKGNVALGKHRQAGHNVLTVLERFPGWLVGLHGWIQDLTLG